MKNEALLSILITTYNRAKAVDYLLATLFEYEQKGLLFKVIVSDDGSSDNTKDISLKWKTRFKDLKYVLLCKNCGMDANFINAYEACDTPYCWLLGDTRCVDFGGLKKIIDLLSENAYDALILNCHDNMKMPSKVYSDINVLMSEQGWHITNNSSCIIPTFFINKSLYHRYIGTTFLHMGIFVENLCLRNDFKVFYLNDVKVRGLDVPGFKKTGWTCHPFLNFGKLWFIYVMSLPNQIDIDIKWKVLKDHNRYTGLFSVVSVLCGKANFGDVYLKSYRENRRYVKYVSDISVFVYDILVRIPSFICKLAKSAYKKVVLK